MTVDRSLSANLLHPFSGVEVKLPHLKTFKDWKHLYDDLLMGHAHFIHKFVLSTSDINSGYIVTVLYGGCKRLGYCKSGDKTWTELDTTSEYLDVIYYKDRFYAITLGGNIKIFNLTNKAAAGTTKVVITMPQRLVEDYIEQLYIVESDGDIFVVFRDGSIFGDQRTDNFDAFKVDLTTHEFERVENLGNRDLFLGHNSSVSTEASFSARCRCSHIYFTDDDWEIYWDKPEGGGEDMGDFSLTNRTMRPLLETRSCNRINPPMWVECNFF